MCDIYQDCAGAYFGSAVVDCAGTCGGSAVEDYCGVCNGTNVANECEEAPNPCLVAGGVLVNMFDSYGDGTAQTFGYDLSCYDNDNGDCDVPVAIQAQWRWCCL